MTTMAGKRALITAGASGIGRAIAEAFAAAGAKVHVCDIDEAALQRLPEQLPGVTTTACDVSDRGAVRRMMDEAVLRVNLTGTFIVTQLAIAPADIAALAVFLASDAGRSISGQAIPIDGDSQSAS